MESFFDGTKFNVELNSFRPSTCRYGLGNHILVSLDWISCSLLLKVFFCIVRTEYTSNKTSISFKCMYCERLLQILSWKPWGSSSVVTSCFYRGLKLVKASESNCKYVFKVIFAIDLRIFPY